MKIIGYRIFFLFFNIFKLCKLNKNKVCCIMHHDSSKGSNIGTVVEYLKEKGYSYTMVYITKEDVNGIKGKKILFNFIPFFIMKSYHLATSSYIFLDDIFLPMSYLQFKKSVKVVQLWHGTGTIKKFGQDSNTGKLKELEFRANQTITHLLVNSSKMIDQYSGAFGVTKDKVYSTGLPRTDLLFQKDILQKHKENFYNEYQELKGKKIILYTPTFRDTEVDHPKIELDISLLLSRLPEEWVLVLKLHPYVAHSFHFVEKEKRDYSRVYNLSHYDDINSLFAVSSLLITDYSSIVFEYCLQGKPMIFYAYDLDEFSDRGRGFYRPYEEFVPGPVVRTTEDLITCILQNQYDIERIQRFKLDHYEYLDGLSTRRLVQLVFND